MVLWFQKKPPLILGVDFNAAAVNVVAFRAGQKEWRVEGICTMPLAPNVIMNQGYSRCSCLEDGAAIGFKGNGGEKWCCDAVFTRRTSD